MTAQPLPVQVQPANEPLHTKIARVHGRMIGTLGMLRKERLNLKPNGDIVFVDADDNEIEVASSFDTVDEAWTAYRAALAVQDRHPEPFCIINGAGR